MPDQDAALERAREIAELALTRHWKGGITLHEAYVQAIANAIREERERSEGLESDLAIWKDAAKKQQHLREAAESKAVVLEAAIRLHRDQRGDDRCWLDDQKLYAVLGEGEADATLPPRETFLANCARYWECRKSGVAYSTREAALEAALRRYGKHECYCAAEETDCGCACGLTKALSEFAEQKPEPQS